MKSNRDIAFNATMTRDDFLRYQFYHLRKFFIFYPWSIALFISLALNVLYPSFWLYWLLLSLIVSALGMAFLTVLLRRRFRKEFNSDPIVQNEISYRITDAGIEQKTIRSDARFEWGDIRSVHRNKDLYMLYVSKNKAVVIPVRFFASKEDRNEFERIISCYVPEKANKLSTSMLPLAGLFFGAGALVIGLAVALGLWLSGGTERFDNSAGSETFVEEPAGPPVKKGEELGSFTFASEESPNLTNIIELREVSVAKENYDSRSLAEGKGAVKVRIYYGENGGILEEYAEYDPNGTFSAEDFEVDWKNDHQATVNVLTENEAGEKITEESFEITVTE